MLADRQVKLQRAYEGYVQDPSSIEFQNIFFQELRSFSEWNLPTVRFRLDFERRERSYQEKDFISEFITKVFFSISGGKYDEQKGPLIYWLKKCWDNYCTDIERNHFSSMDFLTDTFHFRDLEAREHGSDADWLFEATKEQRSYSPAPDSKEALDVLLSHLKHSKKIKKRQTAILAMYEQKPGATQSEIADELGICVRTLRRNLRKIGADHPELKEWYRTEPVTDERGQQ